MKVHMVEWVGGIKNLPAWFKHGEEANVTWQDIEDLYNTGNSVMLSHGNSCMILWVDNKRFTQR